MKTKFKLIFKEEFDKEKEFKPNLTKFENSLPLNFSVKEENNEYYILIETKKEDDITSKYLIDRELDKHFFLTHLEIKAEMVSSSIEAFKSFEIKIYGALPEEIAQQEWNYNLPIQLKLWRMAHESKDNRLKMLNYFQIIELSFPNREDYPNFGENDEKPNPRTECKFIRHLIAHAGEITGKQLQRYCSYLKIPELMLDVTDIQYQNIIFGKVSLLEEQAMIAIEESLTFKNDRRLRGSISEMIMSYQCQIEDKP